MSTEPTPAAPIPFRRLLLSQFIYPLPSSSGKLREIGLTSHAAAQRNRTDRSHFSSRHRRRSDLEIRTSNPVRGESRCSGKWPPHPEFRPLRPVELRRYPPWRQPTASQIVV